MKLSNVPQIVEDVMPFVGPCAMCGDGDARHRMFDAIAMRFLAGELVTDLCDDYELDSDVIVLIAGWWRPEAQVWDSRVPAHPDPARNNT